MSTGSSAGRIYGSRTSKYAHIIERIGLAMAGAACGVFVSTYVSNAGVEILSSLGLAFVMMVYGTIGFYLGIDIPPLPRSRHPDPFAAATRTTDPTELLSAAGTFIAAAAALASVYAIVSDAELTAFWTIVIGFFWVFGVTMQIAAGAIARLRKGDPAIG